MRSSGRPEQILQLRRTVTSLSVGVEACAGDPIILGDHGIDSALRGSLDRGQLHEIYAHGGSHVGAATGFGVALALLAARGKPIVWVRQDVVALEAGEINARGLIELGLDPSLVVVVCVRDCEGVLRAAEQSARCPGVGAVLIEPWGTPKILDLTASRRLALACGKSGVSAVMLRVAAPPSPSAAATRWRVKTAASRPLEANAPGLSTFEIELIRRRGGADGLMWRVEWDREQQRFQEWQRGEQQGGERAPLSGAMVCVPSDRSAQVGTRIQQLRRTG